MEETAKGQLIIIGGAEDKTGEQAILRRVCETVGAGGTLTVLTTATQQPGEVGAEYRAVFAGLGADSVQVLDINTREDAESPGMCRQLAASRCIFLTGGDQLRLTSILGGTASCRALQEVYRNGGVIAGTSAGASVMSATMIVKGEDNEPAKKCTLKMAPGLGLINGTIIDQHFDQRGRFGRLLTGVAENPGALGIGIDENTAIHVYPDSHFEVIGENAVTILDGRSIRSSNVSELNQNEMLAIVGVTVHALPQGYGFHLENREVLRLKSED